MRCLQGPLAATRLYCKKQSASAPGCTAGLDRCLEAPPAGAEVMASVECEAAACTQETSIPSMHC